MTKTIGLLVLLAWSVSAQTNDDLFPRRLVNGAVVNLEPLIEWSRLANRDEVPRPLKAWVVITGTKVGDSIWGWVVSTQSEGKEERLLLKNPPAAELAEFDQLKAQYQQLVKKRQRLLALNQPTNAAYIDPAQQRAEAAWWRSQSAEALAAARNRAAALAAQTNPTPSANAATNTALADLDEQIERLMTQGYDLTRDFPIKCLALKTAQSFDGMVVYDRGKIVK